MGFEQTDLAAQYRILFVVRAVSVEYLQPARFNDELQITLELAEPGASQIIFVQRAQRVLRGTADVLCEARVRVACVSLHTMKPVRIPKPVSTKMSTKTSTGIRTT